MKLAHHIVVIDGGAHIVIIIVNRLDGAKQFDELHPGFTFVIG